MALAQPFDKIGEADLTGAAQTFGDQDRLHLGDALGDVALAPIIPAVCTGGPPVCRYMGALPSDSQPPLGQRDSR